MQAGDPIAEVHFNQEEQYHSAEPYIIAAIEVTDSATPRPLILERVAKNFFNQRALRCNALMHIPVPVHARQWIRTWSSPPYIQFLLLITVTPCFSQHIGVASEFCCKFRFGRENGFIFWRENLAVFLQYRIFNNRFVFISAQDDADSGIIINSAPVRQTYGRTYPSVRCLDASIFAFLSRWWRNI